MRFPVIFVQENLRHFLKISQEVLFTFCSCFLRLLRRIKMYTCGLEIRHLRVKIFHLLPSGHFEFGEFFDNRPLVSVDVTTYRRRGAVKQLFLHAQVMLGKLSRHHGQVLALQRRLAAASVLVLEELEHAKARSAKFYAEIKGFESSCDGYSIVSMPEDGSIIMKMIKRLVGDKKANYYNAHDTATKLNDAAEAAMIHNAAIMLERYK